MPIPPRPEPNHASAVAKAGTERAPPISAAIGFSATTEIHAAPNETPRITSDRLAVIHDVLDSMLALVRAGTSVFLASDINIRIPVLRAILRMLESKDDRQI